MIKALPTKILLECHVSLGLFSKNMVTPNILLFGSVSLNNSYKELNIDMKISFKNQFVNFKFQKAQLFSCNLHHTCHVDWLCFGRKENVTNNRCHSSSVSSLPVCLRLRKVNNKVSNSFESSVSHEHK